MFGRDAPRRGLPGWRVALERDGRSLVRVFSDAKYGGSAGALHVARACRAAVEAVLPDLPDPGASGVRRRRRGAAAIQGAHRFEADARRAARWVAFATGPGGRRGTRSFSVGRPGEDEARRLAQAARLADLAAARAGGN
ncbi:AP2 domain-containing protein [Methylobacterium terrae]|uniref:AP2 domain-containing protein n=1 Tax=Methylobacterium terrae TaxID=2202827 RepID=UPI001FE020C5|nr:AP2 domain-containing protein [Methylobacterium terrae]